MSFIPDPKYQQNKQRTKGKFVVPVSHWNKLLLFQHVAVAQRNALIVKCTPSLATKCEQCSNRNFYLTYSNLF